MVLRAGAGTLLFSIKTWSEGQDFILSYLTEYLSNPGDMVRAAAYLNVGFVMDAVEHGCGIYQRFLFQPGKHFLESEIEVGELMAMDIDPLSKEYLFKQRRFSYMGDCVEFILDGKLEVLKALHW